MTQKVVNPIAQQIANATSQRSTEIGSCRPITGTANARATMKVATQKSTEAIDASGATSDGRIAIRYHCRAARAIAATPLVESTNDPARLLVVREQRNSAVNRITRLVMAATAVATSSGSIATATLLAVARGNMRGLSPSPCMNCSVSDMAKADTATVTMIGNVAMSLASTLRDVTRGRISRHVGTSRYPRLKRIDAECHVGCWTWMMSTPPSMPPQP